MRTRDIPRNSAHAPHSFFSLIHHRLTGTQTWSLGVSPNDTRSAVDMSVEGISEICQSWSAGIHALLVRLIFLHPATPQSPWSALFIRLILPMPLELGLLLRLRFLPQSLTDAFIPSHHVSIWLSRKTFTWEYLGKYIARLHILDIPLLHGFSQKLGMFLGTQQDLNSLPHDPPLRLQRRNLRIRESPCAIAIRHFLRLGSMMQWL